MAIFMNRTRAGFILGGVSFHTEVQYMNRMTIPASLALAIAGCALALPPDASAEETKTLYKCVDAKGVVSIQAKRCPAGSTEAWRRAAQTEPKQTEAEAVAAREREARNQQQVIVLTDEVNRKLAAENPPPAKPESPVPGSHLAGAVDPPEGSHMAPKSPSGQPPDPTSLTISGCQQAQNFAASVREKQWLGLTDDQTRRLFGWVADQCRVSTKPAD